MWRHNVCVCNNKDTVRSLHKKNNKIGCETVFWNNKNFKSAYDEQTERDERRESVDFIGILSTVLLVQTTKAAGNACECGCFGCDNVSFVINITARK